VRVGHAHALNKRIFLVLQVELTGDVLAAPMDDNGKKFASDGFDAFSKLRQKFSRIKGRSADFNKNGFQKFS
jgi:hypothetical protein